MAYLVLLDFENEIHAQDLVIEMLSRPNVEVKGIYKRPTIVCERDGCGRRPAGFTQGRKWGWWICCICAKPARTYWQNVYGNLTNASSFGYNLLDRLFPEIPDESQS